MKTELMRMTGNEEKRNAYMYYTILYRTVYYNINICHDYHRKKENKRNKYTANFELTVLVCECCECLVNAWLLCVFLSSFFWQIPRNTVAK